MRAAVFALLLLALPGTARTEEKPKTLVQFWVRGDDGLTQRFTLDLLAAIKATPGMAMASQGQEPDVVVSILNHVRPERPSVAFTYQVSLKVTEREIVYEGRCDEGASSPCATELFAKMVRDLNSPPLAPAQ